MWSLFASQAIVGISNVFIILSLQNVLGNAASRENREHYFSIYSMWAGVGSVIGPVAGGYLAQHVSNSFVFLVSMFAGVPHLSDGLLRSKA